MSLKERKKKRGIENARRAGKVDTNTSNLNTPFDLIDLIPFKKRKISSKSWDAMKT